MSNLSYFPLSGGCACRAVRYRMLTNPIFVHCCHCSRCQCQSGASFALNAMIETDRVTLSQGKLVMVIMPTSGGRAQKVLRCSECRIAVWSHYAGAGDGVRFVRVGTLDEPFRLPPDIHIFTSSKQPWVVLQDDVPAVAEYYDRDQYWPQESLDRFAALMAARPLR